MSAEAEAIREAIRTEVQRFNEMLRLEESEFGDCREFRAAWTPEGEHGFGVFELFRGDVLLAATRAPDLDGSIARQTLRVMLVRVLEHR